MTGWAGRGFSKLNDETGNGHDDGRIRQYPTGATRDSGQDKPVHWRFGSALVEKRFGEYMHTKRVQSNGELRDGDNWKKGIPIQDYFDSLSRHVNDLRLHMEGFGDEATEQDIETVLCAVKFNVDGMLHEFLKADMFFNRREPDEKSIK